jgi:hypothetical protein
MMYGDPSRFKAHAKKAEAKRKAMKATTMTATDTGARMAAIKRYAKTPGIGAFTKKAASTPTPKGMTPQFREVETNDIEKMIKGGK